jgi:hypothetical protein
MRPVSAMEYPSSSHKLVRGGNKEGGRWFKKG